MPRDPLVQENARVQQLEDALRETVDLCNAMREYAPTLSMKAERRLRASLELLGPTTCYGQPPCGERCPCFERTE